MALLAGDVSFRGPSGRKFGLCGHVLEENVGDVVVFSIFFLADEFWGSFLCHILPVTMFCLTTGSM